MRFESLPIPLAHLAGILRPLAGRRIALIAPAGSVRDDRIDTTLSVLETAGIDVHLGAHARDHHRYLAGTVEARLADLHTAFELDGVAAVWCLRGGYGSAHLVDHIDWSRIPGHVPIIGYSDITVLLEAFRQHGKSGIHGPTATDLARPGDTDAQQNEHAASIQSLVERLEGRSRGWPLTRMAGPEHALTGQLIGGNLTVLASIAGTSCALRPDTGSILLLEDIGEAEFRLERCFHQLLASIDRCRLQAVCLGAFEQCSLTDGVDSLGHVFSEWLDIDSVPVYSGLAMGHGPGNQAWRYGATGRLDHTGLVARPGD